MAVLDIQNLNVTYTSKRGVARAVRNLSLTIEEGETYGIVGESGCGKSTVALSIMRYLPKQARAQGQILFQGRDIMTTSDDELRHLRGNRIAMVYQDPQTSLNPVLTIEKQLVEVLNAHQDYTPLEARKQAIAMLERATNLLLLMVGELRRGTTLAAVKPLNAELQQIEGEVDKLMTGLCCELYRSKTEVGRALFLKDLYDLLERVTDRCRDAGNVIIQIVLKST